ncbi:MAG: hypothetical protein EA417_06330 [Gammaproteobacteria bacterium]|nr:MAG: hypothetical protein EA417_06330 [Gammaproteobacteria bacterium]
MEAVIRYPGHHLLLATGLAFALAMVLLLWPQGGDIVALEPVVDSPAAQNTDSAGPAGRQRSGIAAHLELKLPAATPEPAAAQRVAAATPAWQTEQVRSGDSLARIFQRQGLSAADLQAIVGSSGEARRLARIHPGDTLEYRTDADGALLALRYPLSTREAIEVSRGDSTAPFVSRRVSRAAESKPPAKTESFAPERLATAPATDMPAPGPKQNASADLEATASASGIAAYLTLAAPQPELLPATLPEPQPVAALPWQEERVRSGDSLARIFHRRGLRASELHALLESGSEARRLTRIHPGETLKYRTDDDGRLLAVRYEFSRLEAMEATRPNASAAFSSRLVKRRPEIRIAFREGRIDSSLYLAATRAGLENSTIMNLANVFQWDIDFVHDIRRGDSFHVLFEEHWIEGEKVGNGPIVAAEFVNRGRTHRAVRYTASDGRSDYYAPDGRSMRRAFLRAPVEFSRISSNFNMRRMHPIHNRVVPHRGIDYAAPTGTPVMAAGDGVVTTAASHHANGNYIIIRHGEQYQTKYLHLHRFARGVRSGARVRQGQVIGYVGMTGWATGPHLHYEFLVNGVHQNPRTVNLPQAEPIAESERQRFLDATQEVIASLLEKRSDEQLAMSSGGSTAGE